MMEAKELIRRYGAGQRDFAGATLSGADLHEANLQGADLRGADLHLSLIHISEPTRPTT